MKPKVTCAFCLKIFSERRKALKHLAGHLPWYFGSFICCFCKYSTDRKDRLVKHCGSKEHYLQRSIGKRSGVTKTKIFTLKKQFIEQSGFEKDSTIRGLQYNKPEVTVGVDKSFNTEESTNSVTSVKPGVDANNINSNSTDTVHLNNVSDNITSSDLVVSDQTVTEGETVSTSSSNSTVYSVSDTESESKMNSDSVINHEPLDYNSLKFGGGYSGTYDPLTPEGIQTMQGGNSDDITNQTQPNNGVLPLTLGIEDQVAGGLTIPATSMAIGIAMGEVSNSMTASSALHFTGTSVSVTSNQTVSPVSTSFVQPTCQALKRRVPDSFMSLSGPPPKTPRHNPDEDNMCANQKSYRSKPDCNCDCFKESMEKVLDKAVEQISLKIIKVAVDQTKDLKKTIQESKSSLKSTFLEACQKLQANIAIVYEKLEDNSSKGGSLEPAIVRTLHSSATALAELCLQQNL